MIEFVLVLCVVYGFRARLVCCGYACVYLWCVYCGWCGVLFVCVDHVHVHVHVHV